MQTRTPLPDQLTDAQARLLEFCTRYPCWHTVSSLQSLKILEADDADQAGSLVQLGLLARSNLIDAVQITASGRAASDEHGPLLKSSADRLASFIRQTFPWAEE